MHEHTHTKILPAFLFGTRFTTEHRLKCLLAQTMRGFLRKEKGLLLAGVKGQHAWAKQADTLQWMQTHMEQVDKHARKNKVKIKLPKTQTLCLFTHKHAQIGASCQYYQNKRGCVHVVEKWRRRAAHQSHPSREANSAQHRVQASQHPIHSPTKQKHTHIDRMCTVWCPCEGYSSQGAEMVVPTTINLYPHSVIWPGLSHINTKIIRFSDP